MTLMGLRGQYILYAAGTLVGDLVLFVILYCCKLPGWLCIIISFGVGATGVSICARLSRRYGVYGYMKKRARRRIPPYLRCRSRKLFTNLKH